FTQYAASSRTEKARFRADWLESGRVRVREVSPSDSLIGDVAPGTPTSFGGVTLAFRAWRADAPRTITIKTMPLGEAVRVARDKVHSERTRRDANALDVWCDGTDAGG